MYSLRSRSSAADHQQTKLEFTCRKRRPNKGLVLANKENVSPEKKSKSESAKSLPTPQSSKASRQLVMPTDTPRAPRPPPPVDGGVSSSVTELQKAKSLLHTNSSSPLVGREHEMATITEFLTTHLKQRVGGAMYISGPPGTGKTATLTHLLDESSNVIVHPSTVAILNCMSVKHPNAIFGKIWELLPGGRRKLQSPRNVEHAIVQYITSSHNMTVLVLDELDQLVEHCQHVLYTVFEWPALSRSRLVLIGISNALDLTDRILPRLQAHVKMCPQLLHFAPYTKDQLVAILSSRLSCKHVVFDPVAIQFCSRKVSAVHGDARTALDICRAAIEHVEIHQSCSKRQPHGDTASSKRQPNEDTASSKRQPNEDTASSKERCHIGRVTIGDVASVLAKVYGGRVTAEEEDKAMPIQQKLAVCTLLLVVQDTGTKQFTLSKLYEIYSAVCRQRRVSHESRSEFLGLVGMLESKGIVTIKPAKETMLTKVTLCCQQRELEDALSDKVLLSSILADGLPSISSRVTHQRV